MLLATEIAALVLICAGIDGAVQQKNYQQAGMGSVRKGYGYRGLLEESTPKEEIREVKRQAMPGVNSPGGRGLNVVAVGANGAAEVAFKIDLSLFLERLNTIPNLQQTLFNLIQKVDMLIFYITGGGKSTTGGLSAQIIALEESIIARIQQQDIKINALYETIQQFQGELGSIHKEISQILVIVESLGGGGSGGICAQEMQVIQNLSQQMTNIMNQILEAVQQQAHGLATGINTTIMEVVKQTNELLQQCMGMIERIDQQVFKNGQCAQKGGSTTEIQILQEVSSVMSLMQNIPQKILIILQNSGLFKGPNEALIQYLQQILQISESVRSEVTIVKNTLGQGMEDVRRHFVENQKSLVAVRKVVTETTEIVQSSAAAAISASRSMRCLTKTHKPDLDD